MNSIKESHKKYKYLEFIFWIFAGIVVGLGKFIILIIKNDNFLSDVYVEYNSIVFGTLIIMFPFIFYRIFERTPLEALNYKNIRLSTNYEKLIESQDILRQLISNAEDIANRMYQSSRIHLLTAILIAISGIMYSYMSLRYLAIGNNIDWIKLLPEILPTITILFFIEFFAFFFLKQYRVSMDEFKYYDEIKRNRESQLLLYTLCVTEFKERDSLKIIDSMNLFKTVGVLSKGETTELIESTKFNENEFHKILENLTTLYKESKAK